MPIEFQKAIDSTLTNCKNTYAYLADILIFTKGSVDVHRNTLQKVLQNVDEENLAISIDKSKIACKHFVWLGYHIDSEGTTTFTKKNRSHLGNSNNLKFHGLNTSP